jgi:hypothetical protein
MHDDVKDELDLSEKQYQFDEIDRNEGALKNSIIVS